MSELNIIHPFWEGNGRAIREFIRQLAQKNGYFINWYRVEPDILLNAIIAAVDHDMTLLDNCFEEMLRDEYWKDCLEWNGLFFYYHFSIHAFSNDFNLDVVHLFANGNT